MDATREFLAEKVNRRGKAQITAGGHHLLQRPGRRHRPRLQFHPRGCADHHAGADLLHAPAGGGSPRLLSAEHLPDEPLLRLVSRYQGTGAEGEEPQGHRRASSSSIPTTRRATSIPRRRSGRSSRSPASYDLFLIFDETYHNIIYNGKKTVPLSDIIGDVPGISMKGISKEFPWPGSRCGWMEVYNADKDETFARYIDAILNQKMSEVCSTTLPQMAIPRIMTHPEYQHLPERAAPPLRKALQHRLRDPQGRPLCDGEPDQRRLLHDGRSSTRRS